MPASSLDIPAWTPPKPTQQEDLEWAQLSTLDLSLITGAEFDEIPEALVREADAAFRRDGFAYAVNHGWTYEQVLRQFAIGQYGFQGVSEEEKSTYKADMLGKGSFVGYKNQGHWSINGVKDRIEQLNFGSQSFSPAARSSLFPAALQPLIPEVEEFAKFNHDVILRKVLNVLSLVLKLPVHTLYDLSREPEKRGIDLLRYAMYHTPDKADDDKLGGVRLQGHTDFNSVSVLWSQPITSLEVLMPDNKWRLVKHADNAVVLNLGDAMHFLSGGYLKSCIHRVVAPPADQAHYTRLGCFYFALLNEDVPLETLDSPIIREALGGRDLWAETRAAGKKIPTAGEWERERVRRYGQGGAKKGDDGHEHEEMFGAKVTHYNGERAGQRAAVKA